MKHTFQIEIECAATREEEERLMNEVMQALYNQQVSVGLTLEGARHGVRSIKVSSESHEALHNFSEDGR